MIELFRILDIGPLCEKGLQDTSILMTERIIQILTFGSEPAMGLVGAGTSGCVRLQHTAEGPRAWLKKSISVQQMLCKYVQHPSIVKSNVLSGRTLH
jgi:hypothetical protein